MKKLAIVCLTSVLITLIVIFIPVNKALYHGTVKLLPNALQAHYIGFVLSRDKGIFRSKHNKVLMLRMLNGEWRTSAEL